MRKSIQEVAREATTIPDIDGFWSMIHAQLALRGVSSALFGIVASPRELEHQRMSQTMIWKSSHTPAFIDTFGVETIFDNDVTSEHCVNGQGLLFWNDARAWDNATPAERKRAYIERDLGLSIGVSIPSNFYFPSQAGGIGLCMADVPEREFERYFAAEGREIVSLCGILDAGIRGQHLSELVHLSRRETEVLTWLAVGMRPDRIAERLGVGDKAIEKYVRSARHKLRAATRDHAVAKALMLGLITP